MNINFGQQLQFAYINYKGAIAIRNVIPQSLRFGSTKFHTESQWLLVAYDIDKQAQREFALKDIRIDYLSDKITQLVWSYNINNKHTEFTIPKQDDAWRVFLKCYVCGENHSINLPCPNNTIT